MQGCWKRKAVLAGYLPRACKLQAAASSASHTKLDSARRSFCSDERQIEAPSEHGKTSGRSRTKSRRYVASLSFIEQKLDISQPDDWYTVTLADAHEVGLPKTISNKMQLVELLQERYPTQDWSRMYTMRGRFGNQRLLYNAVASLFPQQEVIVSARKEAGLVNPETGHLLEIDVFVPSLRLAFEFQERHHYVKDMAMADKTLSDVISRDKLKQDLALKSGITLISVPCWWDKRVESLAASILSVRPDLNTLLGSVEASMPIDERPPLDFFAKYAKEIEDIGEPINPCFFVKHQTDPTNWWLFEKYDGIRGFWNPIKKAMFTRNGNRIHLPQEIVDDMPADLFLDGELWFGRKKFQETMKIAHRRDKVDWKDVKYMVFDIPTHGGIYSERYAHLYDRLGNAEGRKFIAVAPYEVCRDTAHLEQVFQDVIDRGGDGIILRDPASPDQSGRSSGYLKHKNYRDAEARIVGRTSSTTWECELPNGVRFVAPAGTKQFSLRWDPQPGNIVSFKHRGYLFGSKKPKLPTLYRIRSDMEWDDVTQNWKEQTVVSPVVPSLRKKRVRVVREHGHWNDTENRRSFLIEFARKMGFDPMVAANWANTRNSLLTQGGSGLLTKYDGSVKALLKDTLPELSFEKEGLPREYWNDMVNRRDYLLSFAQKMGFDAKVKANWRGMAAKMRAEMGDGLLRKYGGSITAMLEDTFPPVEFDNLARRVY